MGAKMGVSSGVKMGGAEMRRWSGIGGSENGQEGEGVVWFGTSRNVPPPIFRRLDPVPSLIYTLPLFTHWVAFNLHCTSFFRPVVSSVYQGLCTDCTVPLYIYKIMYKRFEKLYLYEDSKTNIS